MPANPSSSQGDSAPGTVSNVAEKPDYAGMTAHMRALAASVERLRSAATQAAFAVLDHTLAETPLEDRPVVSWEVEREEFLRRLEQQRSDDDES